MYCSNCGTENKVDSNYCYNCGNKLKSEVKKSGNEETSLLLGIICLVSSFFVNIFCFIPPANPPRSARRFPRNARRDARGNIHWCAPRVHGCFPF